MANAAMMTTAASDTHRNCWRSTPWARRKRTTSDPAATTTARLVTAKATRYVTSTAAATHAHQCHRGEGSDPVGVSSRTKPINANAETTVAGSDLATEFAAGSTPGRASSP